MLAFDFENSLATPVWFVTFLRDPVDRVISHYHYLLRNPTDPLFSAVAGNNLTLIEFVEGGFTPDVNNGYCKLLSDPSVDGRAYGRCSDELYHSALETLRRRFILVGLTKRYDESLVILQRRLGWPAPYYYRRKVTRARPSKEEIPSETLRVIEEYSRLDLALYQTMRDEFNETIDELGEEFQSDVQAFKTKNRLFGRHYARLREGTIRRLSQLRQLVPI